MTAPADVKHIDPFTQDATLTSLRRFTRSRPQTERCDLCGSALALDHEHLLEYETQKIACSCDECVVLLCGQEGSKYLRIPRRIVELPDFAFEVMEWESMMIPIHLAFFLRDRSARLVAMYPSPAGAVRSQLGMEALERRFAAHSLLSTIHSETEALLVNRSKTESCFLVPIDECYRLVGLMRMKWRGLSGGAEVWSGIDDFFRELKQKSGQRGNHA